MTNRSGQIKPTPVLIAELLAENARLRADIAELRAQHAQDQADREHYMVKLGEALAELTKLRTVYAAAVQECRMARAALGHDTPPSLRHDAARAEAGMDPL